MAKKPSKKKRPRPTRAEAVARELDAKYGQMTLKERRYLINALLDRATVDLRPQDAEAIAEHIARFSMKLAEKHFNVPPQDIVMLTPSGSATRLLNAIGRHIDETDEPSEDLIDRLIASLGTPSMQQRFIN